VASLGSTHLGLGSPCVRWLLRIVGFSAQYWACCPTALVHVGLPNVVVGRSVWSLGVLGPVWAFGVIVGIPKTWRWAFAVVVGVCFMGALHHHGCPSPGLGRFVLNWAPLAWGETVVVGSQFVCVYRHACGEFTPPSCASTRWRRAGSSFVCVDMLTVGWHLLRMRRHIGGGLVLLRAA
jgi:hypothetical protein